MTTSTNADRSGLRRNVVLGLRKVDWSDVERQNEFLNCVISAMEALGKTYDYDYLACVSGCAFRACSPRNGLNPRVYNVTNDAAIIGHTLGMLGHDVSLHARGDYETDRRLIMGSIDRGIPVLTFGGVVNCSECCLISGYDDDGAVLMGYNPFMYVECDHSEPADSTGYFRKSNWHSGYFRESSGKILVFGEPVASLSEEEIIRKSLKMAVKLIRGTASQNLDYITGYAGHTRYAELVCADTDDFAGLYLMILCNNNLYQDKLYAPPFLRKARNVLKDKGGMLEECAAIYDRISDLRREMAQHIAEDFSMGERVLDKWIRSQYAQCVYRIRDLEKSAADLLERI